MAPKQTRNIKKWVWMKGQRPRLSKCWPGRLYATVKHCTLLNMQVIYGCWCYGTPHCQRTSNPVVCLTHCSSCVFTPSRCCKKVRVSTFIHILHMEHCFGQWYDESTYNKNVQFFFISMVAWTGCFPVWRMVSLFYAFLFRVMAADTLRILERMHFGETWTIIFVFEFMQQHTLTEKKITLICNPKKKSSDRQCDGDA